MLIFYSKQLEHSSLKITYTKCSACGSIFMVNKHNILFSNVTFNIQYSLCGFSVCFNDIAGI
jgi:hypothetical protein